MRFAQPAEAPFIVQVSRFVEGLILIGDMGLSREIGDLEPPEHIVVIHDELDLPFGTIRLKRGGGDNGHNGLRSVTAHLGTREYYRVRIGIGRPPGRMDPAAYVLRDFSAAERKELPFLLDRAADAVEALLTEGLTAAQDRFHGSGLAETGGT